MGKFFTSVVWLCHQALSGLFADVLVYVTFTLLGILLFSFTFTFASLRTKWKASFNLMFFQFLFFPLLAVVGVIWWNDSGAPPNRLPPAPIAEYLQLLFNLLTVAIGAYFVYLMKGLRLLASIVFMINLWLLFHINFVVGMALTSVWL